MSIAPLDMCKLESRRDLCVLHGHDMARDSAATECEDCAERARWEAAAGGEGRLSDWVRRVVEARIEEAEAEIGGDDVTADELAAVVLDQAEQKKIDLVEVVAKILGWERHEVARIQNRMVTLPPARWDPRNVRPHRG